MDKPKLPGFNREETPELKSANAKLEEARVTGNRDREIAAQEKRERRLNKRSGKASIIV